MEINTRKIIMRARNEMVQKALRVAQRDTALLDRLDKNILTIHDIIKHVDVQLNNFNGIWGDAK